MEKCQIIKVNLFVAKSLFYFWCPAQELLCVRSKVIVRVSADVQICKNKLPSSTQQKSLFYLQMFSFISNIHFYLET